MSFLRFENYRKIITDDMNVLNGRVNTMLYCHSYSFDYLEDFNKLAVSNPSTGAITFNLIAISKELNSLSIHDTLEFCIRMVIHELSHLDQDVDLNRYAHDHQYSSWIERTNENNTLKFIFEHLKFINDKLGDYNFEVYRDAYNRTKQEGTGYEKTNTEKLISNIGDRYILHDKYGRFSDYHTVVLCITDKSEAKSIDRLLLKQGTNFADPNVLYPIAIEIDRYLHIGVENIVTSPGVLMIKVYVEDTEKRLQTVVFRVRNLITYIPGSY